MKLKINRNDSRTYEQLKKHYEFEKNQANILRNASKMDRRNLYTIVYDEQFRFRKQNPEQNFKSDQENSTTNIEISMKFLNRFLTKNTIFLEIGPGDYKLTFEIAKFVKKVYAVDVCTEIEKTIIPPKNFILIISDGCSIEVPENSINIAYSKSMMEHLHPEDAFDQLQNIYSALAPGGFYVCITPNRIIGPHDISKYFDEVATGFHLKEYTVRELHTLFIKVGFSKIYYYIGGKGFYLKFPILLIEIIEKFLSLQSCSFRKTIARSFLFQALLGIKIVGKK